MSIIVNTEKCTGCESCLASCPFDAIEMKDGLAMINEYCQSCMACLETCPEGAIYEKEEFVEKDLGMLEQYRGVLVFAEQRDGRVSGVAHELLGAGRRLAGSLGVELSALVLGASKKEAEELIHRGADKVYVDEDSALKNFNDEPYAAVLTALIKEYKPEIVLAGATPIGRSFVPRVAAVLRAGLTQPAPDPSGLRGEHHGHHRLPGPQAADSHGEAPGDEGPGAGLGTDRGDRGVQNRAPHPQDHGDRDREGRHRVFGESPGSRGHRLRREGPRNSWAARWEHPGQRWMRDGPPIAARWGRPGRP
jgi:NAD-dependent dihydropyrimidine dehydrogenase PreA subunit